MMRQDLLRYQDVMKGCSLFQGLDDGELTQALKGLKAHVARYEKGGTIYRPGDAVKEASLLLEGLVMVETNDAEGSKTNLNILGPGDEFGAHLVFSENSRSPLYVYAGTECAVLMMDLGALRTLDVGVAPVRRMYDNLLCSFAGKCVDLYYRVQIYGKKRIRSRIRLYLMTLEEKDGEVELPMNRTALAAYLGVDRTALARELTRMQQEGLLSVNKRRVRLLNREFFQTFTAAGAAAGGARSH